MDQRRTYEYVKFGLLKQFDAFDNGAPLFEYGMSAGHLDADETRSNMRIGTTLSRVRKELHSGEQETGYKFL